ncbi:MAG: RNA polymerase sigma factor [Armatimonadetes bacterium]|nr:RNA polymerase sigma factor [Armatimonadota bacterium]
MIQVANRLDYDESRKQEDAIEIWMRSIREQYNKPLFRYALALTCSVDDAQDAVQEVFARVSADYHRFLEVTNQKAYLFRATRNSSFSILRKRKRSEALHDAICADLAAICMPHAKDMSVTIISIRSAFDQITIEQREVLVLKILNQLTFKEIAEASGASINTVAARYRYGIDKLRQALGVNDLG